MGLGLLMCWWWRGSGLPWSTIRFVGDLVGGVEEGGGGDTRIGEGGEVL